MRQHRNSFFDKITINVILPLSSSVYIALNDFPKAAETIEKIISIDSSYTYGLYTLARLYQEMKMPSKAITVFESITDKIGDVMCLLPVIH